MTHRMYRSTCWCVALALFALVWSTDAQAQIIFETQFSEDAQEMIGETEKNLSGEDVSKFLMRTAGVRVKGVEEATEGRLLIVFFGEEGEMLHTVASDPVTLTLEPPLIELESVMPGDRVVEGFERTLGEYGFRMRETKTWEPPPIMGISKRTGAWEPPPIMMESGKVNPEYHDLFWNDVREPGIGIVFVPVLGRYSEGDLEGLKIRPAMVTGTIGK